MVIESVAAASAALSAINGLIQQANETGNGVQQLMGTISDFGEAITDFEVRRKGSAFRPLSQNELLKLSMIKKSYDRHWKSVHDLLAMVDPEMLESFKQAKAQTDLSPHPAPCMASHRSSFLAKSFNGNVVH